MVWAEHPIVIKAVPTPGWQTSSVTKPAMYSPVVMMWATVAKVSLNQIYAIIVISSQSSLTTVT